MKLLQEHLKKEFLRLKEILQEKKYHSQKVNTSLTIVCDVTQSIDENDKRGFALKRGLEERDKTGINIRILPIRINSDELALKVTGKNMRILRDHGHHGTKPLFETDSPSNGLAPYKRRGNNELFAGYFILIFKIYLIQG